RTETADDVLGAAQVRHRNLGRSCALRQRRRCGHGSRHRDEVALAKDDLAALRGELERHVSQRVQALLNASLVLRTHEEQQKSASSSAQQLATDGAARQGLFVNGVYRAVADLCRQAALGYPCLVQQ